MQEGAEGFLADARKLRCTIMKDLRANEACMFSNLMEMTRAARCSKKIRLKLENNTIFFPVRIYHIIYWQLTACQTNLAVNFIANVSNSEKNINTNIN